MPSNLAVPREKIIVDINEKLLIIPHLGMTLRTLIGAAASAVEEPKGTWKIIFKGATVGSVKLKSFKEPQP